MRLNGTVINAPCALLQFDVLALQCCDTEFDRALVEGETSILVLQNARKFTTQSIREQERDGFGGCVLKDRVCHYVFLFAFQDCEELRRAAHRLGQKRGSKGQTQKRSAAFFRDDVG